MCFLVAPKSLSTDLNVISYTLDVSDIDSKRTTTIRTIHSQLKVTFQHAECSEKHSCTNGSYKLVSYLYIYRSTRLTQAASCVQINRLAPAESLLRSWIGIIWMKQHPSLRPSSVENLFVVATVHEPSVPFF